MGNKKNNGNSVVAGLTGAVVGVAAGAAAVFLSDKKNRKKVAKEVGNLKDKGMDKLDDMKDMASDKLDQGKKILRDKQKDISKK